MTSPVASGGGGTHFEAKVVAHYLAAILCQTRVEGLPPSAHAIEANTQQADFGSQLDDLVIKGIMEDKSEMHLHLQIKIKISLTQKNSEWKDLIKKAWATYSGDFDKDVDRIGFAIGNTSERLKQCQEAIEWAKATVNGKKFIEKIKKKNHSHEYKREFVETIKSQIPACSGESITDDVLWQFIRSFAILHFDYQLETSSNKTQVLERIENFLPPDQLNKANSIWEYLVGYCGELIPAGGGETRRSLSRKLHQNGLPIGTLRNFIGDIEEINSESLRALDDISTKVRGYSISRPLIYQKLKKEVSENRVIYIIGEPGTGKSALLKSFAIENESEGPIFFLKDLRIRSGGWSAHANSLAISSDINTLLFEFGTRGQPVVFVDGVDRINNDAKTTVNDIVRSVVNNEHLSDWKVIFTLRQQSLKQVKTWLDTGDLNQVSNATVVVPGLEENELDGLVQNFPDLKQLSDKPAQTFPFKENLFFLNTVLSIESSENLPNSEVELLELWWQTGGTDFEDPVKNQRQRDVLLQLAKHIANNPAKAISTNSFDAEILENLKSSSVIKDVDFGISVVFTHDIYEDWAITKLMLRKLEAISKFIRKTNENQILERPLQLLALHLLESEESVDRWRELFNSINKESNLRTLWRRTVLVSCIRSTKADENLNKIFDKPTPDSLKLLGTLIEILPTVEITEDALPKYESWSEFLDWYFNHEEFHLPTLISQLLPLFQAWQKTYVDKKEPHCKRIGEITHEWLMEFEDARSKNFHKYERQPFDLNNNPVELENLEDSIRELFLYSAGAVPTLVSKYLSEKKSHPFQRNYGEKIFTTQVDFAHYVPRPFVDYFLTVYIQHPKGIADGSKPDLNYISKMLGVEDFHNYLPASPIQPPFLNLLNHHEQEGLRLIKRVCNHSISVWRWLYSENDFDSDKRNPIPVLIEFPWATQKFWGDKDVYLWFRGVGGSSILRSALMALEYWAFEQVENGRSIDEFIQTIVEKNECVAVLGLIVSLCMAFPSSSIKCALPIITCPHVIFWDINRKKREDSDIVPANLNGNWNVHQEILDGIQRLNEKCHRKENIASLFRVFIKHSDTNIVKQFKFAVEKFDENLPFEFEEQKENQLYTDYLRSSMKKTTDSANPENLEVETQPTGEVTLKSNPTLPKTTENAIAIKCTLLISWAQRSLENNIIDEDFTIEGSIDEANLLYELDLFNQPLSGHETYSYLQKLALVKIASVVSKYYDKDDWKAKLSWCFEIFQQATALQVAADSNLVSVLDYLGNIQLAAAEGYSHLIRRELNAYESMRGVLILASYRNEKVNYGIATSAQLYATKSPLFYTVLIDLLMRQCIATEEVYSKIYSRGPSVELVNFNIDLFNRAIDIHGNGTWPTIPTISNMRIDKSFIPIVECLDVNIYFSDPILRNQILILTKELVELAIAPSAISDKQFFPRWENDWRSKVFRWCGNISNFLTAEEVRGCTWNQISNVNNENSIVALGSFAPAFMFHSIVQPESLEEQKLAIWSEIAEKIFEIYENRNSIPYEKLRYVHNSAASILFCEAGSVSPLNCIIDESWPHIQQFTDIIEKAVKKFGTNHELYGLVLRFFQKGGLEMFPEPGLQWLEYIFTRKKHDQKFWNTHGFETVQVIKLIYDCKETNFKGKHQRKILKLMDFLIDSGVQRAELTRMELDKKFRT